MILIFNFRDDFRSSEVESSIGKKLMMFKLAANRI